MCSCLSCIVGQINKADDGLCFVSSLFFFCHVHNHFDLLVQYCSSSLGGQFEIRQFCVDWSIWSLLSSICYMVFEGDITRLYHRLSN